MTLCWMFQDLPVVSGSAVYLRKSPRLWFDELVTFPNGMGFRHCPDEPCILINDETGLILFLYVDDLLIITQTHKLDEINQFKQAINGKYGITDLGEAINFFNIRIVRDIQAKKLWICQNSYIDKISSAVNTRISIV